MPEMHCQICMRWFTDQPPCDIYYLESLLLSLQL